MNRKIIVLTALILVPALASAQRRVSAGRAVSGSRGSFRTTADHSVAAQSQSPRSFVTTSHHSAASQASHSSQRGSAPRAFRGGAVGPHSSSSRGAGSSAWFSNFGGRTRGWRHLEPEGEVAPTDNGRTYLNTPGATIRTEGLGFKNGPGSPERVHEIEGGGRIAADERYAQNLTGKGMHIGPRDTPPNPTGASGGTASGNNSITPNSVTNIDNSIGNGNNNGHNSNSGGQGSGNGNGNGGN